MVLKSAMQKACADGTGGAVVPDDVSAHVPRSVITNPTCAFRSSSGASLSGRGSAKPTSVSFPARISAMRWADGGSFSAALCAFMFSTME